MRLRAMRPMTMRIHATTSTHQHWCEQFSQPRTVVIHSVAIYGATRHLDDTTSLTEVYGCGETQAEALEQALKFWRDARCW